jgi:hypothetical protein
MNKQRERLAELLENSNKEAWNLIHMSCCEERLKLLEKINESRADYLLANSVIVPPCKVGDTVYLLKKYYGTYCFNVVEDKVQMIGITSRGIHIKARNHHDHNKMHMLGKTVFLTKEEAEAKLVTDKNVGSKEEEGVQG